MTREQFVTRTTGIDVEAMSDFEYGLFSALSDIEKTLFDTLGSPEIGDYLRSMTKMATTINTYYQMLIKEREEKEHETV